MTMRFDEERDNVVDTERMLAEADQRAEVAEDAPAKIIPIIVTVDELPPPPLKGFGGSTEVIVCEVRHEERNDGANGYDDEDDIEEDDGQPSEYEEWQDFMGGDEYYDHSENACW